MREAQPITVELRMQYGVLVVYPANDAARLLASIAGTKTLTLQTLDKAYALGHDLWYRPKLKQFNAVQTSVAMLEELIQQ